MIELERTKVQSNGPLATVVSVNQSSPGQFPDVGVQKQRSTDREATLLATSRERESVCVSLNGPSRIRFSIG